MTYLATSLELAKFSVTERTAGHNAINGSLARLTAGASTGASHLLTHVPSASPIEAGGFCLSIYGKPSDPTNCSHSYLAMVILICCGGIAQVKKLE